jgi:low temperature requirement protein LtrA
VQSDRTSDSTPASLKGSRKVGFAASNPLVLAANPDIHRSSFVVRMTTAFRESTVKKHFSRICFTKIIPVVLSSLVMLAMIFGSSPVVVLPIVAGIEIIGDFLPSFVIHDPSDWKELSSNRHFTQERLCLFFMLVLGEAILGFSTVNYDANSSNKIYRILM